MTELEERVCRDVDENGGANTARRADRYHGIDRYHRTVDSPLPVWCDRVCVLGIASD
jgi:hypothetical protein